MMQCGAVSQQIPDRACSTGLFIEGPIDDSRHPRPDDCTCAHCAGFEGDDESDVVEAPPSGRLGGIAQSHELSMPERILIDFASIMTAADDRTFGIENHGPDGHVVMFTGQGRLGEGKSHPVLEVRVSTKAEFCTFLRCAQRAA